jgi:hypothetical protein
MASAPEPAPAAAAPQYLTRADILQTILKDARVAQFVAERGFSPSFAALFVSSIPSLPFPTKMSKCTRYNLVVNAYVSDIKDEAETDAKKIRERLAADALAETPGAAAAGQDAKVLSIKERLKNARARIETNIRANLGVAKDGELPPEAERNLVQLMRYCYTTYAEVQLPGVDTPPFVVFLYYTGLSKGAKNGDRNDIDNYTPINLADLDMFHMSRLDRKELAKRDMHKIEMVANTMKSREDGSLIQYEAPLFDPRWLVNYHKKSTQNKGIVAHIKALYEALATRLAPEPAKKSRARKKKDAGAGDGEDGDDASGSESGSDSSSASASASGDEKKHKDKKARKKEKEKKQKEKEKKKKEKEAKKKEKETKKKERKAKKDEAKTDSAPAAPAPAPVPGGAPPLAAAPVPAPAASAPAAALNPRIASTDPLVYDPVFRPYVASPATLAAFGIAPLDRERLATMHVWTDKHGTTGHDLVPPLRDMHALLAHLNKMARSTPSSYDAVTWLRLMLTVLGVYNRSVHRAPFVNLSALNEPPQPTLGTVDSDRLSAYLTKELVGVTKDTTLREAMARETLKIMLTIMNDLPTRA